MKCTYIKRKIVRKKYIHKRFDMKRVETFAVTCLIRQEQDDRLSEVPLTLPLG
jgi:hypothetical protein